MSMYALSLIFEDYIMDYSNNYLSIRSNDFKCISYKRWAADTLETEIYKSVFPRENCSIAEIEDIIRKFETRMIRYSYKNEKARDVFLAAQDVATDILDILRSMGK